jgi:hypothetical protein
MSAFHMHEMPKAKGEFLGFMVLAGSAANSRELLRRRELFGDGVRAGQKGLDCNCKRQLSCLFKADEILNRLISAQEDPGRGDEEGNDRANDQPARRLFSARGRDTV